MSDLLRFLEIGRRALRAQQNAMNTAGHNIANVNTKGFSRQRVNLTATAPQITGLGILGTGVDVESVQRIRSTFIDRQLLSERPSFGQYEFLTDSLKFIEDIFNEPSETGLNRVMEDFWNAWNDLANDPESSAARIVVKERAVTLSVSFNRLQRQLSNYASELNKELQLKVDEINRLTGQIAELNKKITGVERTGIEASDFRDQRDLLIDQLSKLVNVRAVENDSGAVSIAVGGRSLVIDTQVQKLTLDRFSSEANRPSIVLEETGEPLEISGGTLKGIVEIRDKMIPSYLNQLDQLAQTIAAEVNAVHKTGFNLTGDTNISFFKDNIQGAADFAVNSEILENPNLIATSSELNASGNNTIVLAIADLQSNLTMNGGTATFSDFYNSLITEVGSQTRESSFLLENFKLTVEKLETSRESISGVSLDEEMTNLIESQQAFTAAARFISTVDEMLTTILNMI
jgi:flagellar hook-associated protein 1 FlgK